ncbi:MAG: PilZ domain-containing protein [Oligoflexia bacterium]|nr:PilZ domain-containing protein [Oligoflexia bacterium]
MEHFREYQGRRKYQRKKISCEFRLYTSIKRGAYSSKASDISKGGAFIKSQFLPKSGEVITYEILDSMFKVVTTGNAKVVWTKDRGPTKEHGFGVSFEEEIDDQTLSAII